MLVKCETRSNRVKGLSFHPTLSWILASLHNGVIQLWDYRIGSLIDKFEEHEGAVRGVDFHKNQPLFCSGGDDCKIKVWDYRQRRCLFSLKGHMDYIRTVQFHHENPWILSSSDDQTIRIWNWQSRNCVSVLTGHSHYVMCARFHPKDMLVVSASLDHTVRVWDISMFQTGRDIPSSSGGSGSRDGLGSSSLMNAANWMLSEAVIKYELEGHTQGVNWCEFHETQKYIVSCSDDKTIKIWKYNDNRAWEIDTLRGHFNNISCVLFHPQKDIILSNSEDKTIRLWDGVRRSTNNCLQSIRRENDRFWVLASNKNSNLLAAGHDNGFIVFKLFKERVHFDVSRDLCLHVNGKSLLATNIASDDYESKTGVLMSLKKSGSSTLSLSDGSPCTSLHSNPYLAPSSTRQELLICYNSSSSSSSLSSQMTTTYESGECSEEETLPSSSKAFSFDLVVFDSKSLQVEGVKSGFGAAVAFIGPGRLVSLSGTTLSVLNAQLQVIKTLPLPSAIEGRVSDMFCCGVNRVLLKTEEKVYLFDVVQNEIVNDLSLSNARFCLWHPTARTVALATKHMILIANHELEKVSLLFETSKIKSMIWMTSLNSPSAASPSLLYSTPSHVKYMLHNGDSGVIQSLSSPIYLVRTTANKIIFFNREKQLLHQEIHLHEPLFKTLVHQGHFDKATEILKKQLLPGDTIVNYLKKNHYPEVALVSVSDHVVRFHLALQYGNLLLAEKEAYQINDKEIFTQLCSFAMKFGMFGIAEKALIRLEDYEELMFLYFVVGSRKRLRGLLTNGKVPLQTRFMVSVYLGDIEMRVRLLVEAGLIGLALVLCKTHNLTGMYEAIKKNAGDLGEERRGENVVPANPTLLMPPQVLYYGGKDEESYDWPLTKPIEQVMKAGNYTASTTVVNTGEEKEVEEKRVVASQWEEDEEPSTLLMESTHDVSGWEQEDLGDLKAIAAMKVTEKKEKKPEPVDRHGILLKKASHVWEYVVLGEFEKALDILNKRIGIKSAAPLKNIFLRTYYSSLLPLPSLLATLPSKVVTVASVQEGVSLVDPNGVQLRNTNIPQTFSNTIKEGYKLTTQGQFLASLAYYRDALGSVTLASAETNEQEKVLLDMIDILRDYILAMRIELLRKTVSDKERHLYLLCLTTKLSLQPLHSALFHRTALTLLFKAQNFLSAEILAHRFLKRNPSGEFQQLAKQILGLCENKGTDAIPVGLDLGSEERVRICAVSLTVMESMDVGVKCNLCNSYARAEYKGNLCPTCEIASLGAKVLGLQFRSY